MQGHPGENTPENIQIIVDEGAATELLVDDLLNLSQVEAGVRRMKKSRFNLTEEIKEDTVSLSETGRTAGLYGCV